MKKKIWFGVFKFRSVFINVCIFALLGIIATVAFLGGDRGTTVDNTTKTAIYSGNTKNANVSLMVNVYWGTEYVDEMLTIFKENDVKTTFFVGGMWVLDNEALVKKIQAEGHEIANHGYKHKDQKKLSYEQAKTEIQTTDTLIKQITGQKMTLFAPPSGAYSEQTITIAEELGYKTIMWSKDTIDWRDHDQSLITTRATKNIKNGDLVLMHPTAATVQALPNIIKTIKQQGLNITTVSKCLE